MSNLHRFLLLALLLALPTSTLGQARGAGRVLQVGPSRSYKAPSQAAQAAQDGDTIDIDAGTYVNDYVTWKANNLTIRGIGGIAQLTANSIIPNGKAIWVIQGMNTTVESIGFSGARVPDKNGAGIRQEGDGLTVRRCVFSNNEDGILGGGSTNSDVLIEYSEFANNGAGDGYSHNLYIANVRSFTLRYSYSHHAKVGHILKSRARSNTIVYNRLMDETTGTSSYTVNLPNGGLSYLVGNLIQQGPATENPILVSYAEEGATNPDQRLFVVNNTFVNDRTAGGGFIKVVGSVPAVVQNNLFIGTGTVYTGPGTGNLISNLATADAGFVDRAGFDYHLKAGSPAIDAGTAPATVDGFNLTPIAEYVHPANKRDRVTVGKIDLGAYEYGQLPLNLPRVLFLPLLRR